MEMELVGEAEELMEQYVSGVNCAPTTAREEMIAVKKRFGKEDGIVAFHGYQSFAPGECSPAMAHEIGKKLAEELWGSQYQVLIATHLDKANHLHNHFVVNSVSFIDGKRYHRTNQDYRDMRMVSDRLCKEYQLSVVRQPEQGKGKHYAEWHAEQDGKPSYHSMVKADVDEAIRKARTEKQFFFYLREKGYSFKFGKDITVRPEGRERGLKLKRNFGENYSLEAIRVRILEENELPAEKKFPVQRHYRIRVSGNFKQTRKIGGLRGLYLHYCYLLGILPKNRPSISAKQVHVLFREDLLKLNTISKETKLLCHYHIDTAEQLFSLKESLQKKTEQCVEERKHLRYKIRADRPEEEIKEDMGEIYDRVTFYRTMQVLVGMGIVHRIVVDNTTTKYALNTDGENKSHVHFYCRICHAVICLKDVPVHRYQLHGNYKQEDCEVLIKGVCPACMTFDSDNETK